MKKIQPKNKEELREAVRKGIKKYGDNVNLNYIDTSKVRDKNSSVSINKEILQYRRSSSRRCKSWEFLNFGNGEVSAIINEQMLDFTD